MEVSKSHTEIWEENYQKVLEFAEVYGRLPLPWRGEGSAEYRRLNGWLYRQYKRATISNTQLLKLKELEQYGFSQQNDMTGKQETAWSQKLEQLKEFKRQYGHLRVPKYRFASLHNWVRSQRRAAKRGKLSPERKARLLDMGFIFKAGKGRSRRFLEGQEKRWDEMYTKLCAFKAQKGHCNVPSYSEIHPTLSAWVARQRLEKEWLGESRRQRLDKIGFVWSLKTKTA